jgi:hypothetical protein
MSYSEKQTKIEDLRKLLEKFQTSKARYEIYSNRAKAPYTVLIKVGIDFREHKELQRWPSNWKALKNMTHPAWGPEKPLTNPSFMFEGIDIGASIKGLAHEDLGHLLALQDRRHLWGLKDYQFDIKKMREILKQISHKFA